MHAIAKLCITLAAVAAGLGVGGVVAYPTVDSDDGGAQMAQQIEQQTHSAGHGSDAARVDSQLTFRIPNGQAQAVYQYVKDKYAGKQDLLPDLVQGHKLAGKAMSDVSLFTDEYFDTPSLDLFRHRNSCRHRKRVNTTHPDDRKNGRELVQMKVTPPGRFDLRNEIKYDVKPSTRARTIDDVHPVIRLIDKDMRADFKQVYATAGVDAYALRLIFTIRQTRSRVYLDLDGKPFMSFSVDEGKASVLGFEGTFASIDLGLVEIAYTEADEATRKKMWDLRDAILTDLKRQFPDIAQNADSKYSIVLDQIMRQFPLIPLLLRFRLI